MKLFILGSIVVAAFAFAGGVVAKSSPHHLYTSEQTWQGGRIAIETYWDPTFGVQKRVVNIEQGPTPDPATFVVAGERLPR